MIGCSCWLMVLLFVSGGVQAYPQESQTSDAGPRQRILIDSGWRFALGHASDTHKDFNYSTIPFFFAKAGYGDGPASPKFDDRTWRIVDLPHDWAVELPFDKQGDGNHGSKKIGRNFPENSVGWYRRTFTLPKEDAGRRIGIDFDGVYRDAAVWVNGFYIGTEHSGYDSFHYDLTDYLNYGGANVVVVRADATREEGWFYEGAGIYRHVWLTKTAPVHVAHDGTFVTDTVADPQAMHPDAEVTTEISVRNDGDHAERFTIDEEVRDVGGKVVATAVGGGATVAAASDSKLFAKIPMHDAKLWSLETPYLYTLVTMVRQEGKVVDRYETHFGIRVILWDANRGFFLNGKHVELKGTNIHQDHAGVGVALPDGLLTYRVARLKEMGSNAIRTSHNPPTPELLAACDRLGMLVIDENRMMGTTPEAQGELESMILRDRNHPSVILWSVGNEEWSLEWSVFGERLTRDTQAFARRLDPTRLATVAMSGSGAGNSLSTEVLGFNYFLQHDIDKMHARFPERPIVGTEESSSEHTRGTYADDPAHQHLVAYDYETRDKHASVEDAWRFHIARPFSAGLFYWTGFDYRGETTPFGWPAISSQFGMMDTCGFFKDSAYLLQSWWTDAPMVHLLPHWTWPGREGKPIDVRVYSNAASVELMLNGSSLGRKPIPANSHLEWKVDYAAGTLTARGYDATGKAVASDVEDTAGPAAALQLRASEGLGNADGTKISAVTVRVVDARGRLVPDAANLVGFELRGPGKIIGVGNGDPSSQEADKSVEQVTVLPVSDWRAQAVMTTSAGAEVGPGFDDASWERARDPRWNQHQEEPAISVYRGVFLLAANGESNSGKLKLVLRSLGDSQFVYINGHLLAREVKGGVLGNEYVLTPDVLHVGRNVIAILATRFAEAKSRAFTWNGSGPAAIQVTVPAAPWRRSVFHGLAQVIVQANRQAGKIQLTASAPGLQGAVVEVDASPSAKGSEVN